LKAIFRSLPLETFGLLKDFMASGAEAHDAAWRGDALRPQIIRQCSTPSLGSNKPMHIHKNGFHHRPVLNLRNQRQQLFMINDLGNHGNLKEKEIPQAAQ
jgi:hypothetical protein